MSKWSCVLGGRQDWGAAEASSPRPEARPPSLTTCSWALPNCCGHFVCTYPGPLWGLLLKPPRLGRRPKVGRTSFPPRLERTCGENLSVPLRMGAGHEGVKLPLAGVWASVPMGMAGGRGAGWASCLGPVPVLAALSYLCMPPPTPKTDPGTLV